MEILRNIEQIYNKIEQLLQLDNPVDLKQKNFAFEICQTELIIELAKQIQTKNFEQKHFDELLNLVFQLNNYTPIICNLCHMFLYAQKYEELFILVNKIFVAHIGQKYYTSATVHTPQERSFDRLAEIVSTANISSKIFVEFLVNIQKQNNKNYSKWKNPALEYFQNLFFEHEDWLMEFITQNQELKYPTFDSILHFNTAKGVDLLIKDYIYNHKSDIDQILLLLKDFKRETLIYIDANLPKLPNEESIKMIDILLGMSSDNEVMTRIQDLYSTTKSPEIKSKISTKLGISETINIRSEKQFLYAVKRKIKDPQERSLGVPFDRFSLHTISGQEATDAVFSFIIFLFKEEKNLNNLYKLKILENIFVKEELQNFVHKLFQSLQNKDDILQAKWCIRMFALLSSNSTINSTFDFLTNLLNKERFKEAKYLINCLIYSKRVEIIDFIKESLEENHDFIADNLNEFITAISLCLNMHQEDIKDMLVPNKFSVGEFDIQRDRLYSAFIAGKTYPLSLFKKMFIENKIYNKLAQNLVFGEYRHGRLHNAFILNGNERHFIVGATIFEDQPNKDADIVIGIIHPLDLDFKFQSAVNYFPYPTFNQFKPAKFMPSDHSISATTVNRFVGILINPKKFIQHASHYGFLPNKNPDETEFRSIIHTFPLLNLLVEVEFQKPVTDDSAYNTLSVICFYKLSDTMQSQSKFLTQKSNALPIANLPDRYFNHILSIVFEGSKL